MLLFSHQVMFNSFQPHGLQHARLLCPPLSPRVWSNSCPLSQWCHPTISSCYPLLLCLQCFPVSGSFPMSWLFASSGQSIGASALTVFSEYSWLISLRIDWFELLAVQGTLKSLLQHHNSKTSILWRSAFFMVLDYWKNHSFDSMDLSRQRDLSAFLICYLGLS